jgi:hypothetical protein
MTDCYTRDVIQEFAQRLNRIAAEKVELVHKNLRCLVRYSCGGQWGWFIREEVSVISRRQLRFEIYAKRA